MQQLNTTLEILMARFGGQILIPFAIAAKCVGIPEQTARNKLAKGEFPIPTALNGSRRFIHISDLAQYADKLRELSTEKKTRRGPKTKASKMTQISV